MRQTHWRKDVRSPNFSSRDSAAVLLLVLHYTGMQSAKAALSRLCDAEAKVSSHYVVDEDGTVYQLVDEKECAWHAGVSFWRGHKNVNSISIGIEIVNPGHEWGYRPFPQAQMDAVAPLCRDIIARHMITARNVVAHSDIAPQRKEDPGELFDWKWLAGQGVGLWPEGGSPEVQKIRSPELKTSDVLRMQKDLAAYGYEVPQTGVMDEATRKVAVAFQRRFRPGVITGAWDAECAAKLGWLLAST